MHNILAVKILDTFQNLPDDDGSFNIEQSTSFIVNV